MNTSSPLAKQIFIIVTLSRFNFIPKRKLTLFFIGVFIISLITTVMTGYVTGIQQKNYFFPESNDTIILYDKKATTPITGYIEESFAYDLKNVSGILVTSPEIYSTGIIVGIDKPAILHGITKDYSLIHSIKILSGINIFNNTGPNLDSVMVGAQLANLLNLKVNTTFQFNSALKEASRRFFIAGIFQTNSPADEEIFSSMANVIGFSWVPTGFVTLIQVKFNPSIISKDIINNLISDSVQNFFSVSQQGLLNSMAFNTLNVQVYGYRNRLITNFFLTDNAFNLTLPFGLYTITIHSDQEDFVDSFNYFARNNQSQPINLPVGYQTNNLSLNVYYNDAILNTYNLTIFDQFSRNMIFNQTVIINGTNVLPLQSNHDYFVVISYGNSTGHLYYSATDNKNVSLILNTGLYFQVANATTSYLLNDFQCSVYNATTNVIINTRAHELFPYNFFVDLSPGTYKVIISRGSFVSYFNISIDNTAPTFHYFTLGLVNITFSPHGSNNLPLTWKIFDNDTQLAQVTSINPVNFTLQSFHNYLIEANYKNQINTFYLYPGTSLIKNIYFNDSYSINLFVYNGTDKYQSGLPFASVLLSNGTSLTTNTNGQVSIIFYQIGLLNINVTYNSNIKNISITSVDQYGSTVFLPMGDKVHVVVFSKAQSGISVSDRNITIYDVSLTNEVNTFSVLTNNSGIADLYLPLSKTIGIITNTSQEYISSTKSNYFEVTLFYPIFTNITLQAIDLDSQIMSNVYFKLDLQNSLTGDVSYSGFSNSYGILQLINVVLGNYTLYASYRDLNQQITIQVDNNTSSFTVKFYTSIQTLTASDYLHYNSFRNVKIDNASQYFQTFLSSTFGVFFVTLVIMVFITIILMFLSMESIITFPLYQHKQEINSLRMIGTSNNQIASVFSFRLSFYSFIGSFLGIIFSWIILLSISSIGVSNFGGLIFTPKIDPFFTVLSILFIFGITFVISFWYLKHSLLPELEQPIS